MLRIDVRSSRELQALILSIRRANKEVQAEIRKHTKTMIQPEWQKALAQEAMTRFEHRVLVETARVSVSNQNVKLKSGALGKKLSGGERANTLSHRAEFGTSNPKVTATSPRGKKYMRRETRFRAPKKTGYVVFPAAARIIPRLAALWTQTAVRTLYEAFEKKG